MGKNKKDAVYLDNGKQAQNPMAKYWAKQKKREKEKNKEKSQ